MLSTVSFANSNIHRRKTGTGGVLTADAELEAGKNNSAQKYKNELAMVC